MDSISESQLIHETRRRLVGWEDATVQLDLIQKGGSDRHYYRVTGSGKFRGPATSILMVYTDRRPDNLSFFAATEVLNLCGARCPHVYFHDANLRVAWMEDLGRSDLWEHRNHAPSEKLSLYRDALEQVSYIHAWKLDQVPKNLRPHLQNGFDDTLYVWEQDYFFNHFARNFSAVTPEQLSRIRQQSCFHEMAHSLAKLPRFLVHRDFQSQNVIVKGGRAWLIDYQGLRPGRPEYDVASLLYDPYVELTQDERDDLAAYYFAVKSHDDHWDTNPEIYASCCVQRLMQALGAYGFLSLEKGKTSFLQHIPQAVAHLRQVLEVHPLLPGLMDVLELRDNALAAAAA